MSRLKECLSAQNEQNELSALAQFPLKKSVLSSRGILLGRKHSVNMRTSSEDLFARLLAGSATALRETDAMRPQCLRQGGGGNQGTEGRGLLTCYYKGFITRFNTLNTGDPKSTVLE